MENKSAAYNKDQIVKEPVQDLVERKELKKNIKKEDDKNNKAVTKAKSRLIIKIPKPFALGYFIIDLSALLKWLLGAALALLSALVLGLIMSKIADLMGKLMSDLIGSKGSIDQNDINDGIGSIDIKSVVEEAINEEKLMSLNNSNGSLSTTSEIDSTGTYSNDSVVVPSISTNEPKMNKKNNNKEAYSFNKRNRKDLLDSTEANNRLNNSGTNKRIIDNPNYGKYTD